MVQIVSGVPVQISSQVTKGLSCLTDPDTRPCLDSILSLYSRVSVSRGCHSLGDRSETYQVSFSCEMYVSVVQPPEGIQSGVPAQISVHVTNELALLMEPGVRLNFLSRVSQVSLATEVYVDLHSIVVGSVVGGMVEHSSAGMQIGVFSQISVQVRKVFAERIEPWSNS